MNWSLAPANWWTERYETLRRHFVENRQLFLSDPLALTLLLRKGVAGWMSAWRGGSPKTPVPRLDESGEAPLPNVGHQELTRLIAHMTAQHLYPIPR